MGTDIHLYIEKQQPDGSWKVVLPPARDLEKYPKTPRESDGYISPFWGPDGCMYESKCYGTYDDYEDKEIPCPGKSCGKCLGTGGSADWHVNRNYDVFAILADQRNGRGFAGIDTGDGFRPIAMPRGEPEDMDPWIAEHKSWDHTPSWLLLSEILGYDYTQTTKHRGVIPMRADKNSHHEDSYEEWKTRGGRPKSWCGDVSGPNIRTITSSQADAILADDYNPFDPTVFYVKVEWTETYQESMQPFLDQIAEFIEPLADPTRLGTDIRFTFGFDS